MPRTHERLKPGSMHLRHDTRFETYCGLPLTLDGSMNFTSASSAEEQRRVSCKDCRVVLARSLNPTLHKQDLLDKFGSASKTWGKEDATRA